MSRNVNDLSKDELVQALTPGATTDGDYTATYGRLMKVAVEELRSMARRQIASGILKLPDSSSAPTAAEIEAARTRVRQLAANDPELQRERQEVAQAKAEARKSFEDLAWTQFFGRHPEVLDIAANRVPLETYAISISTDGVLRLKDLEEALQHPEIAPRLARTTPKTPATKANLKQDEETLKNYCRQNRLSYGGESALRMLREKFGGGFGGADIAQAAQEGVISLRPETDPQTLAEWSREDEIARATYLRNEASPSELRAAVRAEGQQWAQKRENEQKEASQKLTRQMQAGYQGYPTLPERAANGEYIDRKYLIELSNRNYPRFKELVIRHGSAQVTDRINKQ